MGPWWNQEEGSRTHSSGFLCFLTGTQCGQLPPSHCPCLEGLCSQTAIQNKPCVLECVRRFVTATRRVQTYLSWHCHLGRPYIEFPLPIINCSVFKTRTCWSVVILRILFWGTIQISSVYWLYLPRSCVSGKRSSPWFLMFLQRESPWCPGLVLHIEIWKRLLHTSVPSALAPSSLPLLFRSPSCVSFSTGALWKLELAGYSMDFLNIGVNSNSQPERDLQKKFPWAKALISPQTTNLRARYSFSNSKFPLTYLNILQRKWS